MTTAITVDFSNGCQPSALEVLEGQRKQAGPEASLLRAPVLTLVLASLPWLLQHVGCHRSRERRQGGRGPYIWKILDKRPLRRLLERRPSTWACCTSPLDAPLGSSWLFLFIYWSITQCGFALKKMEH